MKTILLQVDQAGAEALIVAYLCKPGNKLRELFNHGIKPHTYVAMHLFAEHWNSLGFDNLPLDWQISAVPTYPKWKELNKAIKESDDDIPSRRFYYMGKQTSHSANYNIKAPTFIMNVLLKSEGEVVISLPEGTRFLNVYHQLFPEIHLWHEEINERLRVTKTLKNLFGYPREFFGFVTDPDVQRDGYSWIPQSTVGCITHLAGVELQNLLESGVRSDYAVLQNGHDSLLVECLVESKESVKELMLSVMKRELVTERGEKFRMGAEVGEGINWKDIK